MGASARAAAGSARRAGLHASTADFFADRDCDPAGGATRIEGYSSALVDWLREADVDAWFYTGALENHPALVDQLAAAAPLWGNSGAALTRSRNFPLVRQLLAEHGFATPALLPSGQAPPLNGAWLAKTHRGSSGVGVWAIDSRDTLQHARHTGAEVQQRLTAGCAASAIYVLDAATPTLLGVTRQLVGESLTHAAPFAYCGSVFPAEVSPAIARRLHSLGELLAGEFALRGVVGVDLWIDQDRLWVLEINPRYTASVEVIERATGAIALGLLAETLTGSPSTRRARSETGGHAAKLVLFAREEVTITGAFSDWAMDQADLADIGAGGTRVGAGQPLLTVLTAGADPTVLQQCRRRVAQIEARAYANC